MVDIPNNFSTAAQFEGDISGTETTSGSFSSTIDFVGDEDWIQLHLQQGIQYTFTLHSFDPVTETGDTFITLLDGSGNRIGFDDDGGVVRESVLTVTPTTSGVFFVSATNFAHNPGDYVVTVSRSAGLTKHLLTDGDDTYTGVLGDLILGGFGNDTINLGQGSEAHGDVGNDTINGGSLSASMFGGLGDDTISGGTPFNETIYGDVGNDILRGDSGFELIFGGIGNDIIDGGADDDELHGGDDNDVILGGSGNDIIYGNGGNDTLNGGTEADLMSGDAGNDTYVVDNAGDKVSELYGSGADQVLSTFTFSLANTARVFGAVENLTLTGASAIHGTGNTLANVITGNGAANILFGGAGNDTLNGGLGNDRLLGEAGNDKLAGGIGNDLFVFNTALNASSNRDVVTDFNHVADTFLLENAIFTKLGAGVHALNPAFFHAGATAADANDFIVYNRITGVLSYDVNGNAAGGAIAFATLTNKPVLAANDFIVI